MRRVWLAWLVIAAPVLIVITAVVSIPISVLTAVVWVIGRRDRTSFRRSR